MKWLSAALVLMIAPACQIREPAIAPPGIPLDISHNDMAPEKALTKATTEGRHSAVHQ